MLDPLEQRRLFFTFSVNAGTLRIVPDSADAMNLSVTVSLDVYRVLDSNSGFFEDVPFASVARISIQGGNGDDTLSVQSNLTLPITLAGGAGNDVLIPAAGPAALGGGAGSDTADFSHFSTKLLITLDNLPNDGVSGQTSDFSNIGNDLETIMGGSGNDRIVGSAAANLLMGNGGKDTLEGGDANDTLSGGNKNDVLVGGAGADSLVGGGGASDRADYSARTAGLSLTLDGIANDGEIDEKDNLSGTIEVFIGGKGNDTMIGSGRSQLFYGNDGDDSIRGGGGGDTLQGDAGNDTISGEGGDDVIFARDGSEDSVIGGSGTDLADTDGRDDVTAVP